MFSPAVHSQRCWPAFASAGRRSPALAGTGWRWPALGGAGRRRPALGAAGSYYREKHFGGEPYDSRAFVSWVLREACPAISQVLGVYRKLMERGFQVFLVTGRSEDVLGASTVENLAAQGFDGHHRLIMRSGAYKSTIRRQLVAEGYRIRGNVGDQWSDLLGECVRTPPFNLTPAS